MNARPPNLAAVSLRYFNVAGAAFGAGERHGIETHLIPHRPGRGGRPRDRLTIFGDDWPTPDGTPIRDYVHVADLARAHVLALTAAAPGEHLICNLGNGDGFSVRQVLATIEQVTGHPVPVTVGPRRAGDPARLVASAARAADRLGWTPELTLHDMIADAWEFTQRPGGQAMSARDLFRDIYSREPDGSVLRTWAGEPDR